MAERDAVLFHEARGIAPDSWLQEERFRWFRRGYSYAETQLRSIEALSECSPEALYFAVVSIMRANGWEAAAMRSDDLYGYDGLPTPKADG